MGIYHVFYVCNSKKTHLLDRLSAVLSRRHLVVRIQDLIDLQYGDLPARPLLALERDHLVSPLESRVRTKIPAAASTGLGIAWVAISFFALSNEALPMILVSLPFVIWMGWLRAKQS